MKDFPYPAILKPDTGGSGAYVKKIESYKHLINVLETEKDLFAPDQLLLLQEFIEGKGAVIRTEFVDGEYIYGMRVRSTNTFNLCPADACERFPADSRDYDSDPEVVFEHAPDIPQDAIAQSREIVREAKLDLGGVEYIEANNGRRMFFDINATSVYRKDICELAKVDAMKKYGDFIEREMKKEFAKLGGCSG